MKVSIIIVNYHSRAYLNKCLASIFTKISAKQAFEVIVVNNGEEAEMLGLKAAFPNVIIIQNKKNTGFGGGNNLAVREAVGEILFFLNPDTEILSVNISELIGIFSEKRDLGVIGSQLLTKEGVRQKWSMGGEITLGNILKNNLGFPSAFGGDKNQEVAWVSGTALFIRKELFKKIKGFDENFFMYFEDVDLCLRARLAGEKVLYVPAFSILHYGGMSYDERRIQKEHYYAAQDHYFRKHFGVFRLTLLRFLRFCSFS